MRLEPPLFDQFMVEFPREYDSSLSCYILTISVMVLLKFYGEKFWINWHQFSS